VAREETMAENVLYYGDNLDVLRRYIKDESVDLIYLDPPFKSNATYNVLFEERNGSKSKAQIKAFEDTWSWDRGSAEAYAEIVEKGPPEVSRVMKAFLVMLGTNDMLAYLSMMAPRLVELRRVLKPTGSIYLHCDPTASAHLRLLMDAVFGPQNFVNEVIWHYRKWPTGKYGFQKNHDVILFYARSQGRERTFNQLYMERAASTKKRFGKSKIISAFDDSGRRLPSLTTEEESKGVRQDDIWDIGRVPPIKQLFPTQKPEALLERIIKASSNEGDTVLDPFCGCGTAIAAAQELRRRWIGIDITHLAITLIRHRLEDAFGDAIHGTYEVIGEPKDLSGASALADSDPYQFQWWALGLVGARPVQQKKGADRGIDGRFYFHEDLEGLKTKEVILQVKAGHTGPTHVRDLRGVIDREGAEMGVLITLSEPTAKMREEAASAGFYVSPTQRRYPRIQILTVRELLEGKQIEYPYRMNATFKKAPKANRRAPRGNPLFDGNTNEEDQ